MSGACISDRIERVLGEQPVGFIGLGVDRTDLSIGGSRVLQRTVHRASHAGKAALHGFQARAVLDLNAAEVGQLVSDRVQALLERIQLAVPLVVTRADLRAAPAFCTSCASCIFCLSIARLGWVRSTLCTSIARSDFDALLRGRFDLRRRALREFAQRLPAFAGQAQRQLRLAQPEQRLRVFGSVFKMVVQLIARDVVARFVQIVQRPNEPFLRVVLVGSSSL